MRITGFDVYTYDIPLIKPLYVKNKKLIHREGVIIALFDNQGYKGYGEVAPLPGLHSESFIDCIKQLKVLKVNLLNREFCHLKQIENFKDFPESLKIDLTHLLLSHHGRKEWGSPVTPKTPEAEILHLADLLDSRFKKALEGKFTLSSF